MSLTPPASVQKLRAALHAKAKGSSSYRFYALYDKVYRPDVLTFAYDCCKSNKGAAGVDGQTFEDIEAYGPGRWRDELAQETRNRDISDYLCLRSSRLECRYLSISSYLTYVPWTP